jgi:hypothetical protein
MVNPMKCLLLLSLLAAVLAPATANAAGQAFHYDNNLRWYVHQSLEDSTTEFGAAKVVPKPVEVRCYTDAASFENRILELGGSYRDTKTTVAYYDHGSNTIHVRGGTCDRAEEFVHGHVTEDSAAAFATILHEGVHRQGIHDENLTEEMALIAMYAAGRVVDFQPRPNTDEGWKATIPTGVRSMALAWRAHQRWAAPGYRVGWPTLKAAFFAGENWSDYA